MLPGANLATIDQDLTYNEQEAYDKKLYSAEESEKAAEHYRQQMNKLRGQRSVPGPIQVPSKKAVELEKRVPEADYLDEIRGNLLRNNLKTKF